MTPLQTARRYAESGHGAHPGMAACPECGLKTQDGHREGCDVAAMVGALEDAEWRPIAEHDGSSEPVDVWAYWPESGRCERSADAEFVGNGWKFDDFFSYQYKHPPVITHFRPLPPAPLPDEVK